MTDTVSRCAWAEGDPVMTAYHDTEWGVPVRDSRALWEMLMLEGFQAVAAGGVPKHGVFYRYPTV